VAVGGGGLAAVGHSGMAPKTIPAGEAARPQQQQQQPGGGGATPSGREVIDLIDD
jgi:hypothetical protein